MIRLPRTALALSISLACAALFAAPPPAHAQLVIESGPPQPAPAATVVQPAVVQPALVQPPQPAIHAPAPLAAQPAAQPYWTPPVLTQPVPALASGWGKDEPFSLAARQIVPQGWGVHDETLGAVKDARVSWRGGAPWPQVLDGLASSQSVSVRLDWKAKQAWLSLAGSATQPTAEVATPVSQPAVTYAPSLAHASPHATSSVTLPAAPGKAGTAHEKVVTAPASASKEPVSGATATAAAPVAVPPPVQFTVDHRVPPPPPAPSWTLDPSMTLHQNVEAWAKRAGWHVVWNAADYTVIAPATFTGTFAAPDGPLAQLIEGYKGSDQPLIANLTTMDHVVYVYDSHYTPAEVKPATASSLAPDMFDIYGTSPHGQGPGYAGQASQGPQAAPVLPPPDPQAVEAGSKLPPLVIGSTPSKH